MCRPANGFALVVCLVLMVLVGLLAVGLASLASIELRSSTRSENLATARANARLALAQAIGQLQKTLGPDQRVSATSEILGGKPSQPHWTGVWATTGEDGEPILKRDDRAGGLRDSRNDLKTAPAERALAWLVSGDGDPLKGPSGPSAILAEDDRGLPISVPKIQIRTGAGAGSGHGAWWTADLGVRANIRVRDPRKETQPSRDDPENGGWFRLLASAAVDPSMMAGEPVFEDEELRKMITADTAGLTSVGRQWREDRALDFSVDSLGVIADVVRGGLKQDLTAYLDSDGQIPAWKNLDGLSDDQSLVGDLRNKGRHEKAGPRFGLLRKWAQAKLPFADARTPSTVAEEAAGAAASSVAMALANENPVKLAGNTTPALQPILVEATNYIHLSCYRLTNKNPAEFQLRHHHYPRVVLWNPYNVDLDFERAIIMIHGNGRQEMWTENVHFNSAGVPFATSRSQWLSFEGGRLGEDAFYSDSGGIMNSKGYNDPFIGSYYFSIPNTRFAPGECLVFSPARSAEYDSFSPYRKGPYNLNANELSCTVAPDPSRSYYVSGTDIGGGVRFQPKFYWYAPTPYWSSNGKGVENQADDCRAILKHVGDNRVITFDDSDKRSNSRTTPHFDQLPQLALLSASLQYGAGREPRVAWGTAGRMPIELLDKNNPQPTVIPNVRTREGIRLRWFEEHLSNRINSGPLSNTPHFQEALIANWNPRASFAIRSPWENVAGSLPSSGSAGGPWFFGAYTRDLFDEAVSWEQQTPVASSGRYHGNPFGPPQEGSGRYVLFDLPRKGVDVVSIGQFQHAKLSELVWHPSYAIGNSLIDPRLGSGGPEGRSATAAIAGSRSAIDVGGFHEQLLGWSSDAQRAKDRGEWARSARAILADVPESDNLVYDLSFEANHALWDRFFLSTGSPSDKAAFLQDPLANPLPNARLRLAPGLANQPDPATLSDFHRSASCLMIDGAFNVNSTRVDAWKAILASNRPTGIAAGDNVPFPRVLDSPEGAWTSEGSPDDPEVWAGRRELTPEEIERLATAIVEEVKTRGPFLSLADFVNRRLAEDETGRMGALEAAIEKAGINATLAEAIPLDNQAPLPDYSHPDSISDPTRLDQTLKPSSMAWGAPAWLTQADVLQSLGPVLTARSDTFAIRAYGDATDASGRVLARAWCEAVVQRVPEPVSADESGINPDLSSVKGSFGRRFVLQSFRWLNPAEAMF